MFSQRETGRQTLPMCSLYHIAAMGSHGDAQKAPWVAYGHAQSDSDDRLTANPGRLAVEPLPNLYSNFYSKKAVVEASTARTHCVTAPYPLQHSTVYSSTAVLRSTISTTPLRRLSTACMMHGAATQLLWQLSGSTAAEQRGSGVHLPGEDAAHELVEGGKGA